MVIDFLTDNVLILVQRKIYGASRRCPLDRNDASVKVRHAGQEIKAKRMEVF